MERKKILIIKLGYSETLDAEVSGTTSLGDVLRTTVVLDEFKNDHVTWLVDEKAHQLIVNNPLIQRPLIYNLTNVLQLQHEQFDVVINFEKVPGVCALADSIKAWKRFGFSFEPKLGEAISRDGTERVFYICKNFEVKRTHRDPWQKFMIEMIGGKWNGQEYSLGYQPKTEEKFDIGLNYYVGSKWPTKAWPKKHWDQLKRKLVAQGYTVDWQQGLKDLYEYMDWIQSCRALITSDSLGFHLALALKKKVLVIYGPTNANETFMYGLGAQVEPKGFRCVPCLAPVCTNEKFCMDSISAAEVYEKATKHFDPPKKASPRKAASSGRSKSKG